jgi:hypothetical protein
MGERSVPIDLGTAYGIGPGSAADVWHFDAEVANLDSAIAADPKNAGLWAARAAVNHTRAKIIRIYGA